MPEPYETAGAGLPPDDWVEAEFIGGPLDGTRKRVPPNLMLYPIGTGVYYPKCMICCVIDGPRLQLAWDQH